jgi:ParB family chromosome partitioning protein
MSARLSAPELSGEPAVQLRDITPSSKTKSLAETYPIGSTHDVPLELIDENEFGARVFYSTSEVAETGFSIKQGSQRVAAAGYIADNRVILQDGGKRLRGARTTGEKTLRVEFNPPPVDALDNYLTSRLFNSERSSQTSLDDAAQWARLIETKAVASAADLARKLRISEGLVSQTLTLNRIPYRIRLAMAQRPNTCGVKIAYELAGLFHPDRVGQRDPAELESLALSLVEEIGNKDSSVAEARALIASRVAGPKPRTRAEVQPFAFAGKQGQLKSFPLAGRLEVNIKGLSDEEFRSLTEAIAKVVTKR